MKVTEDAVLTALASVVDPDASVRPSSIAGYRERRVELIRAGPARGSSTTPGPSVPKYRARRPRFNPRAADR